jgi:hypothetical protein
MVLLFFFSSFQLSPSILSEELLAKGVRSMSLLQSANALGSLEVLLMKNDLCLKGVQCPRFIGNYDWQLVCSDRQFGWVVLDESQFAERLGISLIINKGVVC